VLEFVEVKLKKMLVEYAEDLEFQQVSVIVKVENLIALENVEERKSLITAMSVVEKELLKENVIVMET